MSAAMAPGTAVISHCVRGSPPVQPPEQVAHGGGGGRQVPAGVAHDLVAGGVAQRRIAPEPAEDLGQLGGAERALAELGVPPRRAVGPVEPIRWMASGVRSSTVVWRRTKWP